MIKVSLNILSHSSTTNNIPMYWEFIDVKEFTNFIREGAIDILYWNFQSYGQVTNTKLGVYIREDDLDDYWEWSFIIKCSNIREYKPYIDMNYDDFNLVLKKHERDKKLNKIL